jgi:hypothetical protein
MVTIFAILVSGCATTEPEMIPNVREPWRVKCMDETGAIIVEVEAHDTYFGVISAVHLRTIDEEIEISGGCIARRELMEK